MKIARLGMVIALILGLGTVMSGCSSSPSDDSLTVGITIEPTTLDLSTDTTAAISQMLLYNVYETLVKMDSDGTIQPLLATGYEISQDFRTYTFHLNPEAAFASGTPVDAQAVIASMNRMRESMSQTLSSQMAVISTVEANEAGDVVVTLSEPSNFWIYSMTGPVGIVFDPAITDLAKTPMGSGPYQFESWKNADRLTLTKNEDYWGKPANFSQVTFRFIPEADAMVSAMLSGDLDIAAEMTAPDSLPSFSDPAMFTVIEGTTNGEVVLGFNHSREVMSNLLVRQAINHGIDRTGLVNGVWGGKGQLIGTMTVPTDPYYEDLSGTYPYNPDKARQLLAQAGVSDLTLSLRVPTTPYSPGAASFIASQLGDIGITVVVEELDFGRWYEEVYKDGDYDMTIVAHVEARDIVNFANPDYYWRYNNPAFQAQLKVADSATVENFIPEMQKAARMLADDAAADWLFVFPNLIVAKQGITGIGHDMASLSFDLTTISREG
ncbi:MAG: ABC transporter substrate-binding protein [Propionibacteriaceae bacterium]|nr:ABC transporter substrate-binding protein [Propionibacteriaceae bacterium]